MPDFTPDELNALNVWIKQENEKHGA